MVLCIRSVQAELRKRKQKRNFPFLLPFFFLFFHFRAGPLSHPSPALQVVIFGRLTPRGPLSSLQPPGIHGATCVGHTRSICEHRSLDRKKEAQKRSFADFRRVVTSMPLSAKHLSQVLQMLRPGTLTARVPVNTLQLSEVPSGV